MTDVIEAASAGVKDMADGSLRITFEFEPRHAAAAFALFGPRGRAVAVAALKDGAAAIPDAAIPASEKPKGGQWAKLAGMWCVDPDFWKWSTGRSHCGIFWFVSDASDAADFVRDVCGIESRADLDHDAAALGRFNELIRHPFVEWMQAQGIQK